MSCFDSQQFVALWMLGKTFREIAEALDIPQGTARSHAVRLGLRRRASRKEMIANAARRLGEDAAPTSEDAFLSERSTLSSPWVLDRIASLGIRKHREWEVPVIAR